MQIDKARVKNILVVRNDRFGEFLLNIPTLRALKETFINANLIVVVNPYVKELAECIPFINEIIAWGKGNNFWEKVSLINLLKIKKIDLAIMLNPSKEFNIFTYLAGIPIRVGYDRKCGFLLTHKMQDKKYLGQKHEVEYNLELVSLVGAKTEDKALSLVLSDGIADAIFKELVIEESDNLVAIHPWTSDPLKQWSIDNFRDLAERLLKELNINVLVIGGKEEVAKGREFCKDLEQDKLFNLIGKTTLKQLAAILGKCRLLISGDSGPVHLAACVGTPVIAIFRSDLPAKSAQRWGPWSRGHIVIERNNLSDITVEEVFGKVRQGWGG